MAFVLAVPLCFLRKARYFVQEVLECIVSSQTVGNVRETNCVGDRQRLGSSE